MRQNIDETGKTWRAVVGLLIIGGAILITNPTLKIILIIIGIIAVFEAIIGYCPMYDCFCKIKK